MSISTFEVVTSSYRKILPVPRENHPLLIPKIGSSLTLQIRTYYFLNSSANAIYVVE